MWLEAASSLMQGALEWSEDLYWDVSPPNDGVQFATGLWWPYSHGQQISPGCPTLFLACAFNHGIPEAL